MFHPSRRIITHMIDVENNKSETYMDEDWTAQDPLISEKTRESLDYHGHLGRKQRHWPALCQVAIFSIYSAIFVILNFVLRPSVCPPNMTNSPVPADAVRYEKVFFNGSFHAQNVYMGEPRDELHEAWSRLIYNLNMRLTGEELTRLNRDSIELQNGAGYYGQLSKYLREVIYDDYYHVNPLDKQMHADHCIDDIRQALMCNPDLSVVTMDWKPNYRRPWPNFIADHTCVNWDRLNEWAGTKSFNIFDQQSVIHPEMDGKIEDISHGPGIHIVWPDKAA